MPSPCIRNGKLMHGRKLKLPELVPGKVVTFGHLSEMAVKHAETHLKTVPSTTKPKTRYCESRSENGRRTAITPQEINDWLTEHCKTPATANRYRAFISLCYRLGMENGKVESNPARLVRTADGEQCTATLPQPG